jgi:hypothetical protein
LGNSIVRAGQSSNSSPTAGVSEETKQRIEQAEANGQQVTPELAQQYIKESIASKGATNLTVTQDGTNLIVGAEGFTNATVDTSQLTDFQSLVSARQGLEGQFGNLLSTTANGRALNLSFAETQRDLINERLATPIHKTEAYINGFNKGFSNSAFHARDRIAGIVNDVRNNRILVGTNQAIYDRDQATASLTTLEKVQLGLDVAGASEIPVVSQVADLGSGGISLYQGDYVGAALSAGSAVPVFGKAAETVRATRFADRIADRVGDLNSLENVVSEINRNADIAVELTQRALARGRITGSAQAFGTQAHKVFEGLNRRLDARLADLGSPISVKPELFRDSAGEITKRRAPFSIGADVEIFENGNIVKALDLKTHGGIERLISQSRQADLTHRIKVPVEEILRRR